MKGGLGLEEQLPPGRKAPQYIAAVSANLGALAVGTMLAWPSPAEGKADQYDFELSEGEKAWIASVTTLASACICFPTGFLMNIIGRKYVMLLQVIPFTVGWLLIMFAQSFGMLLVGRIFVGLTGGVFSIAAPYYSSEIAQDDVRGALGSLFELFTNVGILLAYAIGSYTNLLTFNIICTIIPIIFGIIFFFMPETPYFLIYRGKTDEAEKALKWLRGPDYDTGLELRLIQGAIEAEAKNPKSLLQEFSKRSTNMAFLICMALMLFQQFSGVNAVLFNLAPIFKKATDAISPELSSIIVGLIQVAATFASTLTIDNLGRRLLLLLSGIFVLICDVLLGVYFYLNESGDNEELINSISWLPLVALCVFIVAFGYGFGPIPWLLPSEMCTPSTMPFISSTAGTFNWILAFIVTRTFINMNKGLGEGGTFWLYGGFTLVGIIFIAFLLPETKGKSVEEIQDILNNESKEPKSSKTNSN